MKYAANLSTLFPEVDFLCRFARARAAGFRQVEFLFPYAYEKMCLQQKLRAEKGPKLCIWKISAMRHSSFKSIILKVLLEPLSTAMVPNYLISSHIEMAEVVRQLGLENVKLQFDLFHAQIMHGNITQLLRQTQDVIGHIQVASVPSLQEPTAEEINFPYFCQVLESIGYTNFIGLEYHPKNSGAGGTETGMAWLKDLAQKL